MEQIKKVCGENHQITSYCPKCHEHICSSCLITDHMDHEDLVMDIEAETTKFLSSYQALLRKTKILVDRKEKHITQESIPDILTTIKTEIEKQGQKMLQDIENQLLQHKDNLEEIPLVREYIAKKNYFENTGNPMRQLRTDLDTIVKDLLKGLLEKDYPVILDHLVDQKLSDFEKEVEDYQETAKKELDFIQDLKKLKEIEVSYKFNSKTIDPLINIDEEVPRPKRILAFDREKMVVDVLHLESQEKFQIKLKCSFDLPFRFILVEVGNKTFLTGGDDGDQLYSNELFQFDEFRSTLVKKKDMTKRRTRHAACAIGKKLLFVAGGENEKGVIANCEAYDLKKDIWIQMPSLSKPRCMSSLVPLREQMLYCIGGFFKTSLDSIDVLDMDDLGKGWSTLNLSKKNSIKPVQLPGAIAISEADILIFGGSNKKKLSNDSWVFNPEKGKSMKRAELVSPDAFIASEIKKFEGKVYAMGYETEELVCYDLDNDKWEKIDLL